MNKTRTRMSRLKESTLNVNKKLNTHNEHGDDMWPWVWRMLRKQRPMVIVVFFFFFLIGAWKTSDPSQSIEGSEWIESIKQERAKQTHSTLVFIYTPTTHKKKKKKSRLLSLFIFSSGLRDRLYLPPSTTKRWDMPNERRRRKKKRQKNFFFFSLLYTWCNRLLFIHREPWRPCP